jgi:hypothetical protein
MAGHAGDPRSQAHQGESADTGDARPGFEAAQIETAFDTDQQPAGQRRRDA